MKKDLITQSWLKTHTSEPVITVDVCVLGAGPVAAAAVLQARQQHLRVIQIAPDAHIASNLSAAVPRAYAIAPAVQQRLLQLGVWDLIDKKSLQRCTDMRVFWQSAANTLNERPNNYPIHLSAEAAHVPELCTFVTEDVLQTALNTALLVTRGQSPANLFYDLKAADLRPVLDVHAEGVHIHLKHQANVCAQLCVLAEGAYSNTALHLDRSPTVFNYDHQAIVAQLHAQVAADLTPQLLQTAFQCLGDEVHNDVLALLPMGRVDGLEHSVRYGLVWSQPTASAKQYMENTDLLLKAVQDRLRHAAPELLSAGALSLHSPVQQFPLFASHAPSYSAPRTALVGDTAHKIHPLAGQGLNLGLEDVFALFDIIAQREAWRGVGDARVLARYQRHRKAHVSLIDKFIHAIAMRYTWLQPITTAADLSLRLQSDIPLLGRWFRQRVVRHMTQL
jgi:2-polyprenylphenol 6-hydroxylase